MLSRRADIRDIQHRLERQFVLNAQVVGVCRRDLALAIDGDKAWRREQSLPRADILYPSEEERRLGGGRRILHQVENGVALRPVVKRARAATDNHLLIAEHVIGETEARREMDAAIAVEPLLYALPRQKYAVGQSSRAGHQTPDVEAWNRIGRRRDKA